MNAHTKIRVSLAGLGFGLAMLFAPSVHAQAESIPDHFTETGVEIGPGGSVAPSAARSSVSRQVKKAAPVATSVASANTTAPPVHVAVADKNRLAIPAAPKR